MEAEAKLAKASRRPSPRSEEKSDGKQANSKATKKCRGCLEANSGEGEVVEATAAWTTRGGRDRKKIREERGR